ncbi:MAG: hypothetical protein ACKPEY_03735 [Planctomycetota bacterium]
MNSIFTRNVMAVSDTAVSDMGLLATPGLLGVALGDLIAAVGSIGAILIVIVFTIAVPALVGLAILGPINKVAGRLQAPTRFFLSDFLWLVVQFQLALAYCGQFVGYVTNMFSIVTGFLILAITALWAGAVSFLSRAAVTDPYRRAAFILLLLPITLTVMMVSTLLLLVAIVNWTDILSLGLDYRVMFQRLCDWIGVTPLTVLACGLVIPIIGYALRTLAHWIVRDSQLPVVTREFSNL